MTTKITLSDRWDDICAARIGVAGLTRRAFDGGDLRPLWHELMDKATDDAASAGMAMDLSVISQLLGDKPTGLAIQNDTLVHQRLYRSPCAVERPALRVLAFAAVMDIGGNTPLEFLLSDSDIELVTYYVVPGMALPCPMPDHDIAIVIAPDGDTTRECLAAIDALISIWPRPILNPPRHIGKLDRDRLYHRLQGIPGLEIPQTARADRDNLSTIAAADSPLKSILEDGTFPLIIRPVGSHAGFGLAKIDDREALGAYLGGRAESAFFISRFVNYASTDGMFRKYRVIVIDGKPYACHMAIAEEWKVWYLNADMAVSIPNRMEEAIFMHQFEENFAKMHAGALTEMISRIGLDYFAVDCAQMPNGNLLIFEVDNTAIVHDMDPISVYPYKPPQMRKLFDAVQTMLYRRAGRTRVKAA